MLDGAKVLCKLPVPERPAGVDYGRSGPIALVVGAARCRLKYCLKGQLSQKQPSNQPCSTVVGGGRVVRWCWVNFQCRGVLQFGLQ